jgi:hypothetical protein
MRPLALVALFAVACGVAPSQSQGLAVAYTKGDVHMYSFHSSLDEVYNAEVIDEPTLIDFTALETVTVQSVDPRGVADLSIALSRVVITQQSNGNTDTRTDFSVPPMEVRVAADGRVVFVRDGMSYGSGSPVALGIGRGSGLISAVLPDTPLKVGDTWEKRYDQVDPYGSGKGDGSSDVTTWIDPRSRLILKSHSTGSAIVTTSYLAAAGHTLPAIMYPITDNGAETIDLVSV